VKGLPKIDTIKIFLVDQYSATKEMHLLFSLLRIDGIYMFRALLAHVQEVLQKRHLVHSVRVLLVD
jgi:hypothetical protein